jgi:hypothetical protein
LGGDRLELLARMRRDNSITSENDFTVISSVQKSKAELVLTRVASITLRP